MFFQGCLYFVHELKVIVSERIGPIKIYYVPHTPDTDCNEDTYDQKWTAYNIITTYKYRNLDSDEKIPEDIWFILLSLNPLEEIKS